MSWRSFLFCAISCSLFIPQTLVIGQSSIPVVDAFTGRITTGTTGAVDPRSGLSRERVVPSPADKKVPERILSATVRLAVRGNYGSGTVVARSGPQAFVLTCAHIFQRSKVHDSVVVTVFQNQAELDLTGQILTFDFEADVGVVAVSGMDGVTPIPVADSNHSLRVGDTVYAAGCDGGRTPTGTRTAIKEINRYSGPENLNVIAPPPHGRSGGGLITEDFQLVGVCNGINHAGKDGVYAALACVHRELEKLATSQSVLAFPPPRALHVPATATTPSISPIPQ